MAAFKNTFIFDSPAIGSPAASWGSNIFVIHEKAGVSDDISVSTAAWNQPHQLVANHDATAFTLGLNSPEIVVPNAGLSLELFLTSDTAANHTVAIGVWGKVPAKEGVTGLARRWPNDIDSTNYADPTDMWIPLQNLEAVWIAKDGPTFGEQQAGVIALQMDASENFHFEDGSKEWFMGHRTSVYLAGCTSVCVGVKVDDSVSNGMILGRFVG